MSDPDAMSDARSVLRRVVSTVEGVRLRIPGLASEMAWSSRSAAPFTEALAVWTADLDKLCDQLAWWEQQLERAELFRESGPQTGFRPFGTTAEAEGAER